MSSLQNIIAEADRGQLLEDAELAIQDILTALHDEHDRTDKIERDHFRNIGEEVRNDTSTPVFYVP